LEKKAHQLTWDELGLEGSVSAINTTDTEGFTYGRGFAGKHGLLRQMLTKLQAIDPAAVAAIYEVGFTLIDGKFLYVRGDGGAGVIEEGDAALDAMRVDKPLLNALVGIAESAEHAQAYTDAQFALMVAPGAAGDVPAEALANWDDLTIRYVIHICWGTGDRWASYLPSGGDLRLILMSAILVKLKCKPDPARGGAVFVGQSAEGFVHWANGLIKQFLSVDTKTGPKPLPADIGAPQPADKYTFHFFFEANRDKSGIFWHIDLFQ
jgi:hypothetical protein